MPRPIPNHAESGKLASVANADGTVTTFDHTARNVRGIDFYDLTGITYPDGATESFVYDASGNLTFWTDRAAGVWGFTYNSRGQVLSTTNAAGGVATNTYNVDGTPASSTDPAGNTTAFEYDSLKRLMTVTRPDGTTRTFTYDDNDNILTITNERGNTTTFTYDTNNDITTLTDALGNTTTFAYDGMDRLIRVTDPLGNSSTRTYDELERLETITDRSGNTSTFGYDARGRLTGITDAGGLVWSSTYDLESIIASSTDPLFNTRTFTSDNMGRITSTTSPLLNVTSLSYDAMGRVTDVTNPLGETTTRNYDTRGLVSEITLADGSAASYIRNDLGRITTLIDPGGNAWLRAFDTHGRLTSTTDPLGNTTTWEHDSRDRVSRVTLPAGVLEVMYDGASNVTRRLYSDGTDLDYSYDGLNRLTTAEGIALTYNANGRTINSNGLGIGRDAVGRIASMTLVPGKTVTYRYDSRSLLTEVTDWLGGTTTFTYDDAGRMTAITRPNGVITTYRYDNDSRLIDITEGSISSTTLTRDDNGQVITATRPTVDAVSQVNTYTYDRAGRLTSDGTRAYTWDPASRMTSYTDGPDTVNFTYDSASQVSAYTYDRMGRLTNDGTRTYTWDLASRMTGYTEGADTVTFTYDALEHRVSRTEGGATRSYLWNYAFGLPSISVMREDGSDLRYYVYTPAGSLLYSIEASNNSRRDYHYDEMGNTLFLTDGGGAVIASYTYSPFGVLLGSAGNVDTPFTWQGRFGVMQEGTSGLYYMRARYYDSATGRFISRDPVKTIGPRSINPYQYGVANPMRYIDPMGLSSDQLRAGADILIGYNDSFRVATRTRNLNHLQREGRHLWPTLDFVFYVFATDAEREYAERNYSVEWPSVPLPGTDSSYEDRYSESNEEVLYRADDWQTFQVINLGSAATSTPQSNRETVIKWELPTVGTIEGGLVPAVSAGDILISSGARLRLDIEIAWEERLAGVGDDAQQENIDLQNRFQQLQLTSQTVTNVSKMLKDTAMAIIRKIGN